jgi:hypothetical protein
VDASFSFAERCSGDPEKAFLTTLARSRAYRKRGLGDAGRRLPRWPFLAN